MKAKTATRLLYGGAGAIVVMGILLIAAGVVWHINVKVMNSSISIAVFGAVIAFLGVRYWRSVRILAAEIEENSSAFSWQNFSKKRFQ